MAFLCFSKVPATVVIGVKRLKPDHGIKNHTQNLQRKAWRRVLLASEARTNFSSVPALLQVAATPSCS